MEVSVSHQNCAVTFGSSNYFLCLTYVIIVSHQSFEFTPGQQGHFQGSTHVISVSRHSCTDAFGWSTQLLYCLSQ